MANEAVKLDGGRELRDLLEEVPKRVRSRGLRQGVNAAATPVVKQTRSRAPKASGLLRKAITKKVKSYRGGDVANAIVGANIEVSGEYRGRRRVPKHYFHLVEDGHGDVAGAHMLRDAYEATKDQASEILVDKLRDVLETSAAALAKT